jgi:anti-sigma factor ChrR (cupin superfamily)
MVEIQPGAVVAKHTHPGEEAGVLLNGTLLLEVSRQTGGDASTPGRGFSSGPAPRTA